MHATLCELRKLGRPLVAAVLGLMFAFCLFQIAVYAFNGSQQLAALSAGAPNMVPVPQAGTDDPPPCAMLRMPEGPICDEAKQEFLAGRQAARELSMQARDQQTHEIRLAVLINSPLGAALLSLGMWASFPGACAVGLLAAGHVANEWTGRTVKTLLCQDHRRIRFFLVKLLTLWFGSSALMLTTAILLAITGPVVSAQFTMDGNPVTASVSLGAVMIQAGRAMLVLGAYCALGALASILTRNTVGAIFLYLTILVGSFVASRVRDLAPLTIGYWIAGWMGFDGRSVTPRIWIDSFGGAVPSVLVGLAGLSVFTVCCAILASYRLVRTDVTV